MKIDYNNMRLRSNREGIEIYPLPAIQIILNEYGEAWQPKWEIRIWWIWFYISICSVKHESVLREFRKKTNKA